MIIKESTHWEVRDATGWAFCFGDSRQDATNNAMKVGKIHMEMNLIELPIQIVRVDHNEYNVGWITEL